jgi:D-alanine transaminase
MAVVSIPDQRWARRDIKTVQLLWPSMGKMIAKHAGADDAWMIEDGVVTEGTSNNAYIVPGRRHRHAPARPRDPVGDHPARPSCAFAREMQMRIEERPFTLEEAQAAQEAFVTSATTFVLPVVRIDGHDVGSGEPGPVASRLRAIYIEEARRSAL